MNTGLEQNPARGLNTLRRFIAAKPAVEFCELCALEIPEEHRHLVETQRRKLVCVCDACSILFDHDGASRYRRVPREIRQLVELKINDSLWNGLGIPAGLLFLLRTSGQQNVLALYPSPAGPTEASIDEDTWMAISAAHPAISLMQTDVEALLVNRVKGAREYFIVPVDECYKLAAILRRDWRGFSGGEEAWAHIQVFFASLRQRSRPERASAHA